jgi:hypothetical protein
VDIVVATSVSKRHENKAWGLDEWSVLNEHEKNKQRFGANLPV